ncbi:MAG: glycosyltransferase [Gammaproteobacteria bacterium]|nr:glycosyltransferase [Gammaproteobacteria bacterium]
MQTGQYMFKNPIPWSLRGLTPFLNTYGDKICFGRITKTAPIETNPKASTTVHSAVPHRYVYAYLTAVKSILQYENDFAICVHDDGSLTDADKELIKKHLPHTTIIDRNFANAEFDRLVKNPFLSKVRGSYTSYLKLFDTTFFNKTERIIILDTDTLFIRRPDEIIEWSKHGGNPWYHLAPRGKMKVQKELEISQYANLQKVHIQTLIMNDLDEINSTLNSNYYLQQGFCSGFIGYDQGTINFDELDKLFRLLHEKFGDKIFLWGAEQTTHGLILCSKNAEALPIEKYFVFTQANAHLVDNATFLHFVGENRFHKLIYPQLAKKITTSLLTNH